MRDRARPLGARAAARADRAGCGRCQGDAWEAGIDARACASIAEPVGAFDQGAGFVLVTEEALATADLGPLAAWLAGQPEWSDLPFVLLTRRGGGLERNPSARAI